MTIILKENNAEIRKKIADAGIDVCLCAGFKDSCWLDFHPDVTESVHGVGYYDKETCTKSQEEALALFVAECEDPVYCKDVDEFIECIKLNRKPIKQESV